MARMDRIRQAARRTPAPLALAALVVLAAIASGVSTWLSGRSAANPPIEPAGPHPVIVTEEANTPAEAIEDAYDAARHGDLPRYMGRLADPVATQLARVRTDRGDAYLRDYLVRLTGPIKGLACDLTRREERGPGMVCLPVQFTYADHNETQRFALVLLNGSWRISRAEQQRGAPTLIPYGTPIEQAPPIR